MSALKVMVNLSKADTAAVIGRNRAPTLIVMGSRDSDFKDAVEEADWLPKELGADNFIVEGAGHYPHVEMPDIVGPRVVKFVQEASGFGWSKGIDEQMATADAVGSATGRSDTQARGR